jgi:hypothetical protein
MEQTNNQEVKYNLPNEEEQKKKNRRIVGIFVLLTTIVIDVCSLLAYFATLRDKDNKETYVVSEESKSIYNNLLTYIKNICDDEGHPIPNQIIGINYLDDKLLISSKNDSNEIYVTYDHTGGLEETLLSFKDSIPTSSSYSIESLFELDNEKELNIGSAILDNQHIGIVSKSITNEYYVSFTGLCSCGSMISMVHQPYDDSGNYTNKLNAPKENKLVYDLLYVINYQK